MSWGESRPVARVLHHCAWCLTYIIVGEKHYRFCGEWEGDRQDWRMHFDCIKARDRETRDGENCPERHTRGMTCNQMAEMKSSTTGGGK